MVTKPKAMPANAKPKDSKLKKEMLEVLRGRNASLEFELKSLRPVLAAHENAKLKLQRVAAAAEADAEALFDAIRVLAAQVGSGDRPSRNAREEARSLLESRKITPPHTLGASRKRKSNKSKP